MDIKTTVRDLEVEYENYLETDKGDPGDIIGRLFKLAYSYEKMIVDKSAKEGGFDAFIEAWHEFKKSHPDVRSIYNGLQKFPITELKNPKNP